MKVESRPGLIQETSQELDHSKKQYNSSMIHETRPDCSTKNLLNSARYNSAIVAANSQKQYI